MNSLYKSLRLLLACCAIASPALYAMSTDPAASQENSATPAPQQDWLKFCDDNADNCAALEAVVNKIHDEQTHRYCQLLIAGHDLVENPTDRYITENFQELFKKIQENQNNADINPQSILEQLLARSYQNALKQKSSALFDFLSLFLRDTYAEDTTLWTKLQQSFQQKKRKLTKIFEKQENETKDQKEKEARRKKNLDEHVKSTLPSFTPETALKEIGDLLSDTTTKVIHLLTGINTAIIALSDRVFVVASTTPKSVASSTATAHTDIWDLDKLPNDTDESGHNYRRPAIQRTSKEPKMTDTFQHVLTLLPDGRFISNSPSNALCIRSRGNKAVERIKTPIRGEDISCITPLPNNQLAIGMQSEEKVIIFDLNKKEIIHTLSKESATKRAYNLDLCWAKIKKIQLYSRHSILVLTESELQRWDISTGKHIRDFKIAGNRIRDFAMLSNGSIAVINEMPIWGMNPAMTILDAQSGQIIRTIPHDTPTCALTALPNGLLAMLDVSSTIIIANPHTGAIIDTISTPGMPIAKRLITLVDGRIALITQSWDKKTTITVHDYADRLATAATPSETTRANHPAPENDAIPQATGQPPTHSPSSAPQSTPACATTITAQSTPAPASFHVSPCPLITEPSAPTATQNNHVQTITAPTAQPKKKGWLASLRQSTWLKPLAVGATAMALGGLAYYAHKLYAHA